MTLPGTSPFAGFGSRRGSAPGAWAGNFLFSMVMRLLCVFLLCASGLNAAPNQALLSAGTRLSSWDHRTQKHWSSGNTRVFRIGPIQLRDPEHANFSLASDDPEPKHGGWVHMWARHVAGKKRRQILWAHHPDGTIRLVENPNLCLSVDLATEMPDGSTRVHIEETSQSQTDLNRWYVMGDGTIRTQVFSSIPSRWKR